MAINKARLRKQVERAIKQLPQQITIYHDIPEGDEFDYTVKPKEVATFECFLDRSKSRIKDSQGYVSEGGNIKLIGQIGLIAAFDSSFVLSKDDYFILDGLRHEIVYPKNNWDIYWDCDINVVAPNG